MMVSFLSNSETKVAKEQQCGPGFRLDFDLFAWITTYYGGNCH